MKTRMILSLGLSALIFGGTMVGCTATGGNGIASASDRNAKLAAKAAATNANDAARALARRDAESAIGFAEAAVEARAARCRLSHDFAGAKLSAGRSLRHRRVRRSRTCSNSTPATARRR